jgi:hypothetical protein
MGQNLKTPMPAKASFTYGTSGERSKPATKIMKGQGDLRSRKSNNNGK